MQIIYPPQSIPEPPQHPMLFLAGSIEMGKAVDWQAYIAQQLETEQLIILNPRRKDWDSSWTQRKAHPQFYEQVCWELDGLERADLILVYFAPDTKAPITLMELGLHARSGKVIVCCPDGYWRKGNVEIVCERFGIQMVDELDDLWRAAKNFVSAASE